MSRRYFGTDGVRGIVGETLTIDLVERLGRAVAAWSERGHVFVGRDTRSSGPSSSRRSPAALPTAAGQPFWAGSCRPRPSHSVPSTPAQ